MPSKKTKSQSTYKLPPLSSIYRKIAVSFVVLTVLLVGIIVFFSMSKATVTITPKQEIRSAEFLTAVRKEPAQSPGVVQGSYEERTVEEEGRFEASGITEKQGRAEGVITVINASSVSQPLVATTRFLSPEGILFRTKERVVAPANGRVDAQVYADEPGAQGDIGPTERFTIPGLRPEKQEVIYGKSKDPMVGGAQKVRVVTAEDLERARTEVIEKAEKKVSDEFRVSPEAALKGIVVESEVLEASADVKEGDERQTFTVRAKIKAKLLAYDKKALEELALQKVSANVPSDRELSVFNKDTMIIRIKNVNAAAGEIQFSVYADAEVRLNAASPVLDAVKIAGMLPEEAQRYLESFDAVEGVEIKLFPSWQKRIPTIPDRIKIVIRKD